MEQELGKVNKLAAKHASFSGIAIHEYRAWKELHDLDR